MALLLEPLSLRSVTVANRIGMSPMCQYSASDGLANDWHLVHLGSRAVGGTGLILIEATAVEPIGRITPGDLGIWSDTHIEPLSKIARFLKAHGAVSAIQLAHAGRKAGKAIPWEGGKTLSTATGGWTPVSPSALAFDHESPTPHALTPEGIHERIASFAAAARRALAAGIEVIEIHAAHGYLIHEFLSPLSNRRTDGYGGSFGNRIRLLLEIVEAVRKTIPDLTPLLVRISGTDWAEGGWDIEQSVELAKRLKERGVDLVDVSSGGLVPDAKIPAHDPEYQVKLAARVRTEAQVMTAAVGGIHDPREADAILRAGKADLVFLGRELLREPYWALKATRELGQKSKVPNQYMRGIPDNGD